MFVKLLKHDFRSTWGLLGVLSLLCLGAGAAGSLLLRYLDSGDSIGIWEVFGTIGMIAITFYLIAYSLAAIFILLNRFYKSRFTDEGFLTFTLPVTTHQVLLSSFLNCFLGLLVAMLVTCVAFGMYFFFGVRALDGYRLMSIQIVFQRLPELMDIIGAGNLFTALLMCLAGIASEILIIMLSITIGAVLVKKHKLLIGVVAYYVIHMVINVGAVLLLNFGLDGIPFVLESSERFPMMVFGGAALGLALVGAVCYGIMYYLTNRKLNLN